MRCILDSNVIIDFCSGKMPERGKDFFLGLNPEISIITNMELFATSIPAIEKTLLEQFVLMNTVHEVNLSLLEKTIEIRQTYKIKLPDAIIAATAIVNNLPLITRNLKDFERINILKCINPHDL